jgi:hypothetical protein
VAQRARRLVLADADFDEWPLEDAALLQALTEFVHLPGRQVLLLGRSFDAVARRCPRFVQWRRTWGHAVEARRPVDDDLDVPTVLLADRILAVEVLDKLHWRGRILQPGPAAMILSQEIDAFAQRTEPTFGATTLGL